MIATLLQLWWIQKKRTFSWFRLGVLLYFIAFIGLVVWGFFTADNVQITTLIAEKSSQDMAVILAMTFVSASILTKILMKKEACKMDDSIRSRPIRQSTWTSFIILTALLDYWTLYIPLLAFILAALIMPLNYALATAFLSLLLSFSDALVVTGVRAANSKTEKTGIALCYITFLFLITPYVIFGAGLMLPILHIIGMGIAVISYIAFSVYIIYHLDYHDEQTKKKDKVKSRDGSSLWTMNWAGFRRTSPFKYSTILFTLIMVLDAYLFGSIKESAGGIGDRLIFYGFTLFAIAYPSIQLGQQLLCIEGNFMDGLFTRPFAIQALLESKFRFFALLNAIAMLPLIPGIFFDYWSAGYLIGLYLFSMVVNLSTFHTCLTSRSIELFSGSYFKFQKNTNSFDLRSLITLMVIGIFVAIFYFVPQQQTALMIVSLLGIVAVSIHRIVIRKIAKSFLKHKYKRLEEFRK